MEVGGTPETPRRTLASLFMKFGSNSEGWWVTFGTGLRTKPTQPTKLPSDFTIDWYKFIHSQTATEGTPV
jgi:hypothetical protein